MHVERYELRVDGMSCTGCEERVRNAVKQIEGVRRVDADHETGTVEIAADEDAEDAVRTSILDAGYDVPA